MYISASVEISTRNLAHLLQVERIHFQAYDQVAAAAAASAAARRLTERTCHTSSVASPYLFRRSDGNKEGNTGIYLFSVVLH